MLFSRPRYMYKVSVGFFSGLETTFGRQDQKRGTAVLGMGVHTSFTDISLKSLSASLVKVPESECANLRYLNSTQFLPNRESSQFYLDFNLLIFGSKTRKIQQDYQECFLIDMCTASSSSWTFLLLQTAKISVNASTQLLYQSFCTNVWIKESIQSCVYSLLDATPLADSGKYGCKFRGSFV